MIIVYCTVPTEEVAKDISRALVTEKLCACVNQVPKVKSYYVYDGEFCEDDELLLMIKTSSAHFNILQQRIKELHPYEVPEIIATQISESSQDYQTWLLQSLS